MRAILACLVLTSFAAWGIVIEENQNLSLRQDGETGSVQVLTPTAKLTISGPYLFIKITSAEKANLTISFDDCFPQGDIWKGAGEPDLVIKLKPRQKLPQPLHVKITASPIRRFKEGTFIKVVRFQGNIQDKVAISTWHDKQAEFELPGELGLYGIFLGDHYE